MEQGPTTPPSRERIGPLPDPINPEGQEFNILRPGYKKEFINEIGRRIHISLREDQWAIAVDHATNMILDEFEEYFLVWRIDVLEESRRKGIATQLYEAAAKLSAREGRKGIVSRQDVRSKDIAHVWKDLKKKGKAKVIEINNILYDFLPANPADAA